MSFDKPMVYAVRHLNESVRAASRSGGIFTALSDEILSNGGVIYGCALSENLTAVHIRAERTEERNRMRGSKYIQSKLGETFKNVKTDLDAERQVLFSGTSCQVAGLKKFLGKEYKNLVSVDIVCHGVPSTRVWLTYLRWLEQKNHSKIIEVDFRNKKDFGWRDHVETICFENGKIVNYKVFTSLFYGHCILRPSCYECPYKSVMHPGDITIADYWGIEKALPEFDDNKGVSLVLINTVNGEELFNAVKGKVKWKQTKLEDSMQTPLQRAFPKPCNREKFWKDYSNSSFEYIARKYGGFSYMKRIKTRVKNMINEFIKRKKGFEK